MGTHWYHQHACTHALSTHPPNPLPHLRISVLRTTICTDIMIDGTKDSSYMLISRAASLHHVMM